MLTPDQVFVPNANTEILEFTHKAIEQKNFILNTRTPVLNTAMHKKYI